ncbi:MAG: hypothetical protein IJ860_08780 [Eubacterium sp.]|nr:hypothetical protein [Eubacterium sp.]
MKKGILRLFGKLLKYLAVLYGILFAVFYFDLDGKFLFYIWEPLICRHYDRLQRKDRTQTPYGQKDPVLKET